MEFCRHGAHRDIVGELEKAIHEKGMKFVTSFHKARTLQVFQKDSSKWLDDTSYFPYDPDMPTSSSDSLLSIMYGNAGVGGKFRYYGPD